MLTVVGGGAGLRGGAISLEFWFFDANSRGGACVADVPFFRNDPSLFFPNHAVR